MNVIISPETIFTVTGVLMLLHGAMFFFGAEDLAATGVPNIIDEALSMGKGFAEIVTFFNIFIAAVLLFCRDIDLESAKKVLTGVGVGCVSMVVGIVYHMQSLPPENGPPLPVLIIFLLLSAWAFYIAILKKD